MKILSISLKNQTELTGTTSTSTSKNAYSRFFCNPSLLTANFCYILPAQRPKTTTSSTKYASVPIVSGDNPVNGWDPSGKHQCNGDPLTWIGCVGNAVQSTVNRTLKTVKSVVIDQVQKQINEIRQFMIDLKGLRSSQCSSSDLIPPGVTKPRSTEKSLVILKLSKNDCVVLGNSVLVYNC